MKNTHLNISVVEIKIFYKILIRLKYRFNNFMINFIGNINLIDLLALFSMLKYDSYSKTLLF